MDIYQNFSYTAAQNLTDAYSTSFGLSSKLFERRLRRHIYAIYGMVRIADEIVDTYRGPDQTRLLESFHQEVLLAMRTGYGTNPLVYAFATTAREYGIDASLVDPFFESMTMDIDTREHDSTSLKKYIYGSAEVIGLMCLRVFCDNDQQKYQELELGARLLGSAYQKINFLRDMASDYTDRGRWYLLIGTFDDFNNSTKAQLVHDIRYELEASRLSVEALPRSARYAVRASYRYYGALLDRLEDADATRLQSGRISTAKSYKLWNFMRTMLEKKFAL